MHDLTDAKNIRMKLALLGQQQVFGDKELLKDGIRVTKAVAKIHGTELYYLKAHILREFSRDINKQFVAQKKRKDDQ